MSNDASIDKELLKSEIAVLLEEKGYHLLELKVGGDDVLRLVVHKEPGVTHADCGEVAKLVSAWSGTRDGADPLQQYMLEVSSPGLTRTLKSFSEAVFFTGHRLKITLQQEMEIASKMVKEVTGVIREVKDATLQIEIKNGETLSLDEGMIRKLKLTP